MSYWVMFMIARSIRKGKGLISTGLQNFETNITWNTGSFKAKGNYRTREEVLSE